MTQKLFFHKYIKDIFNFDTKSGKINKSDRNSMVTQIQQWQNFEKNTSEAQLHCDSNTNVIYKTLTQKVDKNKNTKYQHK